MAEPSSSLGFSQACRRISLAEIHTASNNLDESLVIGRGGFGKVYKGTIVDGENLVVAAIKRLDSMSHQGANEFWAEVEMLSQLRHCIGYCNEEKEMILVYEYMPHGTLEDHLHKLTTRLSWVQRLKICIGAARGLQYLHTGTGIDSGVIHRDVKSSNILLLENWAAKVSDFGLSRVGPTNQPSTIVNTLVKGTFGYLDPDYFSTGRLTRKSDVFAFGVVLFEMLCRKRAVDKTLGEEQWGMVRWAKDSIKQGRLNDIVDSGLRDQISPKCLEEFAQTAHRCLHSHPKKRPTMAEVVVSLESTLALQQKIDSSLQPKGATIFDRISSLQPKGRTIFDRIALVLPFRSKGNDSAHVNAVLSSSSQSNSGSSDHNAVLSSSSQSNSGSSDHTVGPDNDILENRGLPADHKIPETLKIFKLNDLKKATRNFNRDRLLGEGGFGRVFLGWVDMNTCAPSRRGVGTAVAVKRFNKEGMQGYTEWLTEVQCLGGFSHPNIITLLGYCRDKKELLLVYDYMQNGSFDHLLFRNQKKAAVISWGARLNIMIGVAYGLTYLHSLKNQVVCRSLKSADILLDQECNAKLGDFGFMRRFGAETGTTHVSTRIMGNYGYVAPGYVATGRLYAKSDVYSFGVVLLEAVTGRRVIDQDRGKKKMNLVEWARPLLTKKKRVKKIIDPCLKKNYPMEGAMQCAALIASCLAEDLKVRPSSEQVLRSLKRINAISW